MQQRTCRMVRFLSFYSLVALELKLGNFKKRPWENNSEKLRKKCEKSAKKSVKKCEKSVESSLPFSCCHVDFL